MRAADSSISTFRFAVLALILLTVFTRLPALVHPQAIDSEGIYSVVANEIVDGGRPYLDAVERKPPLLFWTFAAVFKVAGKYNWPVLHIVTLAWTFATMAGLYAIGAGLFDRNVGLIAALFYSVFQPVGRAQNLALDGELMMNLPIVLAWAIGFRETTARMRPELFLAGALLGAAFLLKQPAAIAAVPLGIYLLLPSYRKSRGLPMIASFIQAGMLTAGFAAVLAGVSLILQRQGILHEAIYWTIGDHTVPYVFWTKGILVTLAYVVGFLPLLLGSATAIRDNAGLWRGKKAERLALLGLLVASAIGAAAGARFYEHYYIQLVPPLALLAAPLYANLWSKRIQPRHWLLRPSLTYVWLAILVILLLAWDWIELSRRRQPLEAGRYLLEHSAPSDRIFVWGQTSKIYLDAQRRPACRYVATFPLTGHVFGGLPPGIDTRNRILPGAWDNLKKDFASHPPAYIVDNQSEPGKRYPVRDFPILAKLLAEHYQPIAYTAEGVIYRINASR